MKTIIIPDLHGCLYTLHDALNYLCLSSDDRIIFLGDYLDKGPNSLELINFLIDLKKAYKVIMLKGNHEAVLLQGIFDNNIPLIKAYKETDLAPMFLDDELKTEYFRFLDSLLPYYLFNGHLFVHAGIDLTQESIDNQGSHYYYNKTLGRSGDHNIQHVIHGHFVTNSAEITKNVKKRNFEFSIDNGCYMKGRKGFGKLVTFDLDEFFITFHKKSKFDE